jgi:hypothetical protein
MTRAKWKAYASTVPVAALSVLAGLFGGLAHAANQEASGCIQITTAAQLQAMQNNLAGSYCLAKDIDAGSIVNFKPVGDAGNRFTGRFYGNGHVIKNLTITNATTPYVGLFGAVGNGTIQDVGLVNADVTSNIDGYTGALIGLLQPTTKTGGRVQRVYSTGKVVCTANMTTCFGGGLIGAAINTEILDVWSSTRVDSNFAASGLIGSLAGDTIVRNSHATGDVTCTGNACGGAAGFSVQLNDGDVVHDSFATGKVRTSGGLAGGFVALIPAGGAAYNVYATGAVIGGANSTVGGLIGQHGGELQSCFAAGPVQGGAGASVGGLIGDVPGSPTVTDCYWDTDTSGQMTTAKGLGTARTTVQLRHALTMGLNNGSWGITKTKSYPFLNTDGFSSNLATLVRADQIYTALPIMQSDKAQYIGNPVHTAGASLATVYTMVARAIGQTVGVASLDGVKINKYFWHDATQTTTFSGPVTAHATLGAMVAIAADKPLDATNVIGKLSAQNWVMLRGTYKKPGGGTATHYMLATLYTKKGTSIDLVIANDPFTGEQVAISPTTKTVVEPQNFPLTGFKVNGYATISNIH